jgi:hypothetical protein
LILVLDIAQMQCHFYATRTDLAEIFSVAEAAQSLTYAVCGVFDSPKATTFTHASDFLDHFGKDESADFTQQTLLVTQRSTPVVASTIRLETGQLRYAIDQLENPESVTVDLGGPAGPRLLLPGRVATASRAAVAIRLQKSFTSIFKARFRRVRAYWVGPEAYLAWQGGWRLTVSSAAAPEFDLAPLASDV